MLIQEEADSTNEDSRFRVSHVIREASSTLAPNSSDMSAVLTIKNLHRSDLHSFLTCSAESLHFNVHINTSVILEMNCEYIFAEPGTPFLVTRLTPFLSPSSSWTNNSKAIDDQSFESAREDHSHWKFGKDGDYL